MDYKLFCSEFYASHFIPVCLIENRKTVCSYPAAEHPVIEEVFELHEENPYIFTKSEGKYALLKADEHTVIALGPENELTYNRFLSLVSFLFLTMTGKSMDLRGMFSSETGTAKQIETAHAEQAVKTGIKEEAHGTWQFENMLLSLIRDGQKQKLEDFLFAEAEQNDFKEGKLADDALRQSKNLFIGLVTQVGKISGIGGGMNVEEAYQLIDLYVQECERMTSVDEVKQLQFSMIIDFTDRISGCRVPDSLSHDVFIMKQFIENNTSRPIGIDDVASCIARSRSYATKKFREEMKMSIHDYLEESRILDARRMLRYTDRSIDQIAYELCFSSQPHFQKVFRQQTGMTPNEYRKKHAVV